MDLEKAARELMNGKNGAALAKKFDGAAIERAAKSGDSAALSRLLKQVLSTPEGASFAAQVQRAVKNGGR